MLADLLQRHLLRPVQPGPHPDHLTRPGVQVLQQVVDAGAGGVGLRQHLLLVRPHVGLRLEQVLVARHVPLLVRLRVRDRAGEVLHDRPRRVGAELEPAAVVELLHRPHQRQVAVAHQVVDALPQRQLLLRLRVHEPLVATDEGVAALADAVLQLLHPHQVLDPRLRRVDRLLELVQLVLQEVHLPEHVLLLLLGEQRPLVQVRHVRRHVLRRGLADPLGVEVVLGRHLIDDHGLLRGVVELGVVDVIDRRADQFLGPHLVHHPVHAGPGAAESLGDEIHGIPGGFGVL